MVLVHTICICRLVIDGFWHHSNLENMDDGREKKVKSSNESEGETMGTPADCPYNCSNAIILFHRYGTVFFLLATLTIIVIIIVVPIIFNTMYIFS